MKHNLAELATLDIAYHDTTTFGDYTIKVEQDDMGESPREWDNLGTMVYWHNSYNLGDVDGAKEYGSPRQFFIELSGLDLDHDYITDEQYARAVEIVNKNYIMLPLYLYDHSGITMSTGAFSCPWDSGQVGHIYVSKKKIREEFGAKRVSAQMVAKVEGYLTNEVKEFDNFITGNIHYFSITREDEDGEVIDIDSCGGYHGDDDDYMFNEIKSHIKHDIKVPSAAEGDLNVISN